jgi:ATP-citrate lyase alpha-subunit
MTKPDYQLFDENTTAIIFGYQQKAVQRMLDFDAVCNRETPSVAAIVNPTRGGFHKAFFGDKEVLIPMYRTLAEAAANHPTTDVVINFASYRSAYATSIEALETETIKTVVIIAEGIPEQRTRQLVATAKNLGKWIIGPATVGGVAAGSFKIGNSGGTIENIINSKLHRPGSVGFVSKSGGMSNEMYNVVARNADGIFEGVAIGGDAYAGSSLLDHLLRMEQNPAIKMLVLLGEVGGSEEHLIADAVKSGQIKKPLIAWVTGTCAKEFPTEVQFGHAGAKSGGAGESADEKNAALKQAGAIVPDSFDNFDDKIRETYEELIKDGIIQEFEEPTAPSIPMDYATAVKEKKVRKATDITCSISCDTGEEATYYGEPISSVVEDDAKNIGYVLGLLWFKKQLPPQACQYIEMVLQTVADHGPCVSGAHNAIVAARAGKDVMSSLASGLLTIGPRFGGAIDGAATYFKDAYDRGLEPLEFVKEMKKKGINIPGIGHAIKSTKNPDRRVVSLKKFAKENFNSTPLLDYALKVEELTTSKKANLILNVDGCIGITFVDMMKSLPEMFTEEEVNQAVELGMLNGLFVLGRSIGIMGHVFDQKRLGQGLYRYPMSDVLYLTKGETN